MDSLSARRAILLHALDTVDVLVEVCGDFLSLKVSEDLWPLLRVSGINDSCNSGLVWVELGWVDLGWIGLGGKMGRVGGSVGGGCCATVVTREKSNPDTALLYPRPRIVEEVRPSKKPFSVHVLTYSNSNFLNS